MFNQKIHHQESEDKGDYSVSEPHPDLLLTKSGYIVPGVHHKEPRDKSDYSVSEPCEKLPLTKIR